MTKYGYYRSVFGHSDIHEQRQYLLSKGVDPQDKKTTFTETPSTPKSNRRKWLQLIKSDGLKPYDEIFVPYLECLGEKLLVIATDICHLVYEKHVSVTIGDYLFSQSKEGTANFETLNFYAKFQHNINLSKAYDKKVEVGRKGGRPRSMPDYEKEEFNAAIKMFGIKCAAKQFKISLATAYNYRNKWKDKKKE